jgi:hypothetical protein
MLYYCNDACAYTGATTAADSDVVASSSSVRDSSSHSSHATAIDTGSEPIGTVAVSLGSFSLRRPSWASPKGLRHKLQMTTAGADVSPRRRSSGKSPLHTMLICLCTVYMPQL